MVTSDPTITNMMIPPPIPPYIPYSSVVGQAESKHEPEGQTNVAFRLRSSSLPTSLGVGLYQLPDLGYLVTHVIEAI